MILGPKVRVSTRRSNRRRGTRTWRIIPRLGAVEVLRRRKSCTTKIHPPLKVAALDKRYINGPNFSYWQQMSQLCKPDLSVPPGGRSCGGPFKTLIPSPPLPKEGNLVGALSPCINRSEKPPEEANAANRHSPWTVPKFLSNTLTLFQEPQNLDLAFLPSC
jgi:hypothetical protein